VNVFADSTDTSTDERFSQLQTLPPSAKLVYKVLEYEGAMTQSRLAEETLLPTRTVRYALSELDAADLVTEDVYIPDARKRLYRLRPVASP
jgi:DNA-binding MarR family transcriptional regulator